MSKPNNITKPLTVKEVATILNFSTRTIRRHIQSGDIPSFKIGRTHRIPADFIQGLPGGSK